MTTASRCPRCPTSSTWRCGDELADGGQQTCRPRPRRAGGREGPFPTPGVPLFPQPSLQVAARRPVPPRAPARLRACRALAVRARARQLRAGRLRLQFGFSAAGRLRGLRPHPFSQRRRRCACAAARCHYAAPCVRGVVAQQARGRSWLTGPPLLHAQPGGGTSSAGAWPRSLRRACHAVPPRLRGPRLRMRALSPPQAPWTAQR